MAPQGIAFFESASPLPNRGERKKGRKESWRVCCLISIELQDYVPMWCMCMHHHSCPGFHSSCRSGRQLPWRKMLRLCRHNTSAWRLLRLRGNCRRYRWVSIGRFSGGRQGGRARVTRTLLVGPRMASGPAAVESRNEANARRETGRVYMIASGLV